MTTGLSPWATNAVNKLGDAEPIATLTTINNIDFTIHAIAESVFIVAHWPHGAQLILRTVYSPDDEIAIKHSRKTPDSIHYSIVSNTGNYELDIELPAKDVALVHYKVRFKPTKALLVPYWPRDIIVSSKSGHPENTAGEIYIRQLGIRSGIMYGGIKRPKSGSFLYFQNLTSINQYCQDTQTSVGDTVGGQWPELGFALPPTNELPMQAGKDYIINDAYVLLDNDMPADQFDIARCFLNNLALIYKLLPKPQTVYHDYPEYLQKSLSDIQNNPGCWQQFQGLPYLNAYLCDYTTPPEIMVQLAVLMPMYDYQGWSGETPPALQYLHDGLSAFYDEKLGTIMRYLPSANDMLDESEEQKSPKVMDSWYLHHPLLNLSRMALNGDEMAHQLFIKSAAYAIKVAHYFKYQWPVFYKMDTLEVVKAETQTGQGGEKDVAGIYAHVMLQAWELTRDKLYLKEAEKAAKTLVNYGFDIFYQANNTAFSAGATLRLYKETKDELYLNLSYLCLANLFKNVSLWQCEYGYGKSFPNFFAIFPLNDAPYNAVYEEQECFAAFHDYLEHAESVEILPAIRTLLAEFIKYMIHRAVYYFPPLLPEEMLSEEVKTGQLDKNLWVALEDIQPGWDKAGKVGQEVYGAGLVFGVVPRHFIKIADEDFMIFINYPVTKIVHHRNKCISFNILGDSSLSCRMCIITNGKNRIPALEVQGSGKNIPDRNITPKGNVEYTLKGNQHIKICW